MIPIVLYSNRPTEKYLALDYRVSCRLYNENGEARCKFYLDLPSSEKANTARMTIEFYENNAFIKLYIEGVEKTLLISDIIVVVERYSVELFFEGTEEQLEKLRDMLRTLQREYRNPWNRC
jgi:hypothetical protein